MWGCAVALVMTLPRLYQSVAHRRMSCTVLYSVLHYTALCCTVLHTTGAQGVFLQWDSGPTLACMSLHACSCVCVCVFMCVSQILGVVALGLVNVVGVLTLSGLLTDPQATYALYYNGLGWIAGLMPALQVPICICTSHTCRLCFLPRPC
jgi:hypothetical protein